MAQSDEGTKYQPRGGQKLSALPVRVCVTWTKRFCFLAVLVLSICCIWERTTEASTKPPALEARSLAHKPQRVLSSSGHGADGEGNACQSHQAEHTDHTLQTTLCFLVFTMLVASFLDHWNVIVPEDWRLPISVVVFMFGMGIGALILKAVDSMDDTFVSSLQGASYLDPHAIFFVLLPPLLFESAGSMSWHVLTRVLPSAVILAGPGVVMNTFLTGAFVKFGLHVEGVGAMSWEASLLLSSILSATDPVAVVAALHSLGAPKKLATLVEGESLLNDGSAVVFFGVFLDMVATSAPDSTKQCPGVPPAGGCVTLYFLRLALGGPALGLAISMVLYLWIGWARARESPVLEISIILTAVYGGFFLAESLHVSGVLAVVTLGIVATADLFVRMSHEGRHALHLVLAQIAYACNHVIFMGAGIISARFMWNASGCFAIYKSPRAWADLLMLYVVLHVARALVIAIFLPLLSRLGYGITWKEGAVLVWGGLRGAVGLALGLLVEHNEYVDERIAAMIAFHVSGIVLLTLCVNGITVDNLYRVLQPYPPNPYHMTYLRKSLCILEMDCGEAVLERMLDDWFFKDVDFESILSCVPNFARIEFNAARVPYPTGISSVKETLNSLEFGATRFKSDLLKKQKETWMKAFSDRRDSWDEMKDSNASQFLSTLWEAAASGSGRDHFCNIHNTGDQKLDYKAVDSSSHRGLYVSSQPLDHVSESTVTDTHSYSVKVLGLDGVHAIVGLVAHSHEEESNSNNHSNHNNHKGEEEMILGSAPNSVGFDLTTGKMRFNGTLGEDEVDPEEGFTSIPNDSTVHVIVMHELGGEWQVKFTIGDSDSWLLASCTLGPFAPDQLYPAIQFLPLVEKPAGLQKLRTKSFTIGDLSLAGSLAGDNISKPAKSASLQLSYEPHTASDEESLRQLFHVFFNMVTHEYHQMHDHGLIGDESFDWLLTSVEVAVDNAEGEVNRTRAQDFTRLEKFVKRPSSKNTLGQLDSVAKENPSRRTFLHVFEPIVVEYLAIEQYCSTQSLVDRLSRSWVVFRRYDYHRMLVKVETLWAFVEVHEMVLSRYTAMERFPDLVKCLRLVVSEAKRDLALIADIKPRRYWYSKHFLALKVLMTKKRETLHKFAKEGWLARDDCEHLNKALRDRAAEVEHFVPRLYRGQGRDTVGGRNARVQSVCIPSPGGQREYSREETTTPQDQSAVVPDLPQQQLPGEVPMPSGSPVSATDSLVGARVSSREQLEAKLGLSTPSHLPGFMTASETITPHKRSQRMTPEGKRWDADSRVAALGGPRTPVNGNTGQNSAELVVVRAQSVPQRPKPKHLSTGISTAG